MAADASESDVDALIEPSLYRLTEGLPNRELKIVVSEAKECEEALLQEIELLESALKMDPSCDQEAVDLMLASEFTPPDQCWTVSALLGRLREPLATPLPPNTTIMRVVQQPEANKKKTPQALFDKHKALFALESHDNYLRQHTDATVLLALWKRISSHRTAAVFRRPVNPKEAPGYTDRILFPIDLSLIRKMIVARIIVSYKDLHQRVGLICHNCVKYNGRESDYAVVTREFEAYVDEVMVQTVITAAEKPRSKTPEPSADLAAS
jgi:hypothetical protein